MALTITMSRSIVAAALALITCGCSAGREPAPDPCVNVHAAGKVLATQSADPIALARATAQHVVRNPDCYKPELVAQSEILLAQPTMPPPTWLNSFGNNPY